MAVPFMPPPPMFDVGQLSGSTSATSGFVKATTPSPTTVTATGASSVPSTSGFNAGLGGEHASAGLPASSTAESSGLVTGGGLASSPIVAGLPSAESGIHSEGLTRAELNAKKAEVITGHKLEELTPREQAAAQLGAVGELPGSTGAGGGLPAVTPTKRYSVGEEPSLVDGINNLFHKATQAAYNAVPPSVISKLEGGNSPTASPTARRASLLFEQAKHVLGVHEVHPGGPSDIATSHSPVTSTTTIPAGTTVVAEGSSSLPKTTTALGQTPVAGPASVGSSSPTLVEQVNTVSKDVGRRASAVLDQAKHLLGVDEVFPGGISSGHVNKGKESEMAHTRRPSVADQAKGIFNNVIGAVKAEFEDIKKQPAENTQSTPVVAFGGLGLASAGIVGATAFATTKSKPAEEAVVPQTKPSEEVNGAIPGEKSDGVGALPGSIKEAAVAVPPDVKANPDPLGEGVGGVAPQSWHTASTDAGPSTASTSEPPLAPALGGFVGVTPADIPAAIESKPIAEVPVAVEESKKEFVTGTPAFPIGSAADSTASTDAIIHGTPGHGVTGAGIGLDADKSLPPTPAINGGPSSHLATAPALMASSAPGEAHEGVGSTTNGSVSDKTTLRSEPHSDVPEKFAAVGHGTVDEPASSKPARDADETNGSANGHGRQGSTSSNGKKSGFMNKVNKIKAKLTHD